MKRLSVSIACALALIVALSSASQKQGHSMVFWAEKLLSGISEKNTAYIHKNTSVSWGDDGNTIQCYADCSGFINSLIAKTYNWSEDDFKKSFGKKRPFAYTYYDAVAAGNHFQQINNIKDVITGDLVLLKYTDRSEHEDNTGHCMLVISSPRKMAPEKVIERNTVQYEIMVMDCSKSPHGKNDTRNLENGEKYDGLGKGAFRLYADRGGKVVAYSWSTGHPKPGFDPYENPVTIGRFIP
ncbi:MAG: hypothetical protein JST47_05665 [Bacteroidetes bacterium]|nr:hypothetical protein [Bacteroidota bacterium]MBS1974135.1 hypothetical protein [Bacteroidota bacterium]